MRVILLKNKTIPKDSYEEVFLENSAKPFFVPLLCHKTVDQDGLFEYLSSAEFEQIDSVIITSHRAVEAVNAHLEKLTDAAKLTLRSKPMYTVGPATAKVLRDAGYTDIRGADLAGNGSILSDLILEDFKGDNKDRRLVFFTGETRKDIIPRKIAANSDLHLMEKVVYRTDSLDNISDVFNQVWDEASSKETKPWVVFFSPSGTEAVISHLESLDRNKYRIASIGPTTEEYLVSKGFHSDHTADKPTAQSLLAGLTKFDSAEQQDSGH